MSVSRRNFVRGAAGLFVPAMPALILPREAAAQLSGGLMFPGPGTPASSGGGGFSLVWSSTATTTGGGPSVNYGTMTYASGATRIIAASIYIPGATTGITGITIGGVALAQVSGCAIGSSTTNFAADVWESTAPLSGSSGTVIVTYASALGYNSSIALYSLTTTTPAVSGTPGTFAAASLSSFPATTTVPTGGIALTLGAIANGTPTNTNSTIDSSPAPGGNKNFYGHTTSTGSVTYTMGTSTATSGLAVIAAWGP